MDKFKNIVQRLRIKLTFDKSLRIERRRKFRESLKQNRIDKAKFGVSYSVWDGEELLKSSIIQIRNQVDYINVVWQEKSWTGLSRNANLKLYLEELQTEGLIDELIEYKSLCDNTYQEPAKRQLGLEAARRAGCNYFLTMDTDEFYVREQFTQAKKRILEEEITHSFVLIKAYGSSPLNQWSMIEMSPNLVPFFVQIDKNSQIDPSAKYPYISDPSRKISLFQESKFMFLPGIAMHHMTFIRKDLLQKVKASSASGAFEKMNITIEEFARNIDENSVLVEDQFGLCPIIATWQKE